jgi:hypothetical protein
MIGGASFVAGAAAYKLTGMVRHSLKGPVSGYSEGIRRSIVKVVINASPAGAGSGFCIARTEESNECIIASASHVVDGNRLNKLVGTPGSNAIISYDGSSDMMREAWCHEDWMDVCAFHSQLSLQPLPLAEKLPEIGTPIYAVGFPNGGDYEVAEGIFSGLTVDHTCRLETTAAIVPGYSGGPILTKKGEVIGMAVTYQKDASICHCVPLNELRNLRDRMLFVMQADKINSAKH